MLSFFAVAMFPISVYAVYSKIVPTNLLVKLLLLWGCVCSGVYLQNYNEAALHEAVLCLIMAALTQASHQFAKMYHSVMK